MIEKLSRAELDRFRATASYPEYEVIADMRKGEGGKVVVADAGVSRQTVKNRLKSTAKAYGIDIKFLRSKPELVVFEIAGK
jgi:hypothetical protein